MEPIHEKIIENKSKEMHNNDSITKKIIKSNAVQGILHIVGAQNMVSPKDRNEFLSNLISNKMDRFDPNSKALLEKATDIRTDIIFGQDRKEDTKEIELFKKYLSIECIKEYRKNARGTAILNLYADHAFPRPIQNAAKKSGTFGELKRIENAWGMGNYGGDGLKKGCRIYFKEDQITYMPGYQVNHITYKAKDGELEKQEQ